MTDSSAPPGEPTPDALPVVYYDELDPATAADLPGDDPNLAVREGDAGTVDHEALIGDVDDDDPLAAAVDARSATVEDDVEPDDDEDGTA